MGGLSPPKINKVLDTLSNIKKWSMSDGMN